MSDHDHSACRQMLKDLSDFVDGDLDEALCREIERHMSECENCRVVVDTLRKTVVMVHCLPSEILPTDVEERLIRRLELTEFVQKD